MGGLANHLIRLGRSLPNAAMSWTHRWLIGEMQLGSMRSYMERLCWTGGFPLCFIPGY
jgi:hypothetical protein